MQIGVQPCIESDRLKLRPYTLDDSKKIQLLAGDIRIAKETMNIPHPYEHDMAVLWIASLEDQWRNGERVEFAIIVKETDEYVGGMSFVEVNGDVAEIGYWIGEPYWNNGYCAEAGARLVEFGFAEMSLGKITARHLSTNPRSGNVLRKLGLVWKECSYQKDRDGNNVKFEFYETPSI
jgi:ribosomal-protein-alanine N-acetyltransferase